jgi:hypothetical protein
MPTTRPGNISGETRKVVKRETVKLQRLVLGKRGVHVEVDQYVMLDVDERLQRRSPVKLETLKLNIIKDCNSIGAFKGNTPSMPPECGPMSVSFLFTTISSINRKSRAMSVWK